MRDLNGYLRVFACRKVTDSLSFDWYDGSNRFNSALRYEKASEAEQKFNLKSRKM